MKKNIFVRGTVTSPENILVDLPHGLGDIIMCFPLFASIKAKFPECRITVLSPNKASGLLLKYNRHVSETFYLTTAFTVRGLIAYILKSLPLLRKKQKKEKFDLYISVHPNIIRTINRIFCCIPNKVENRCNIHKTAECLNILSVMNVPYVIDYSLQVPEDKKMLSVFGLDKKEYIVLDYYPQHLQADPRRWEYFDELARLLKTKGITTVAAGMNKGHVVCDADVDLINKTGFDELLHVIAGAKAVVCMDTGFFHLAYALNVPVLGLFGPVNPADRVPYNTDLNVHVVYNKLDCSPCIKNKVDIPCARINEQYLCMRSISAKSVAEKIMEIIRRDRTVFGPFE
jgi:ADP-heptose:LPS heptosyltransferase